MLTMCSTAELHPHTLNCVDQGIYECRETEPGFIETASVGIMYFEYILWLPP